MINIEIYIFKRYVTWLIKTILNQFKKFVQLNAKTTILSKANSSKCKMGLNFMNYFYKISIILLILLLNIQTIKILNIIFINQSRRMINNAKLHTK